MDEVESLGGPLICIESRLSLQWRGIDGLSVKPDASMAGISTDYERTYLRPVRFLDALALTRGAALILGDRPMMTGVWKNSLNQAVIWRISYAEEDDDVPSLLASLAEASFASPLESIEFAFGSPNVIIFDSALPGDEGQSESVSFDIAPGRYRVTTHVVRPAASAEFVLHRFHPVT
jgi:Immunity protein 21